MMRIVVVDDDELFRRAVTDYFTLEGFEVESFPQLSDVSVLLKGRKPDMIVCDVMLPGRSGVDILKQVRVTPEICDVPFIFLTARTDLSFQREAMNLGGDDYVTKPVSADILVKAVRMRLMRFGARRAVSPQEIVPDTEASTGQRSDLIAGFERLTNRERDVLALLIQGLGNLEIGKKLSISEYTVKRHLLQVFVKMNVESRAMTIATVLRSPVLVERLSKLPAPAITTAMN